MFIPELLTVALVHLLAVMSPGPDFILILRNSLLRSRKAGIYSAIGLGFGITVHVIYSLIGIGLIISKSIILFSIIKFLGAAYLIYIGYKSLTSKPTNLEEISTEREEDLSKWQAVRMGFLTNVLNPKATLFFLALFTQIISPITPKFIQIIYGVEMSVMTFVWFALVAMFLSHDVIRHRFLKIQARLEKFFGVILIGLGVKVALSSPKN